MGAGNAFEPLIVQAKFPIAEVNQYAASLQGAGGAASQMGVAQDSLTAKTAVGAAATEKVSQAFLQEKIAAQQAGIVLNEKAIAEANAARASGVHNLANTELEKSFSHTKREMREFTHMGEHLTGVHTGLSSVIRMAMNPAMLAMGVVALAVGHILEHQRKVQEEFTKAVEESTKWVQEYSKALTESKDKLLTFDAFQQQIIKSGHELGQIKLEETLRLQEHAIDKQAAAAQRLNDQLHLMLMAEKEGGLGLRETNEDVKKQEEALRLANATLTAARLRQEELTRAQHAGFQTVEEYEGSLKHWSDTAVAAYNLTHKISAATQAHAVDVRKLTDEFDHGAMSIDIYNKRLADLQLIFIAAQKREQASGAKHDSTILNERKAFWDQRHKMDAENQQKGLARDLAVAQAEERAEEEKARKLFGKSKELAAALLAIRTEYNAKMRNLVTANTNMEIAAEAKNEGIIQKEVKAIQVAIKAKEKSQLKFLNDLAVRETKYLKNKLAQRLAEQHKEEAAFVAAAMNEGFTAEQLKEVLARIARDGAAERVAITKEEEMAKRKMVVATVSSYADNAAAAFGNNKALAMAAAGLHILQGIMADIALGWPMMIPAMIVTTAIGDQTMRKIQSAQAPAMNKGQAHDGLIFPRSGSYMMNVTAGEGIMKDTSMNAINQMLTNIGKATQKRGGKGAGSGDTHMHFNAPMYANENHAIEYARRVQTVNSRRNVSPG